MRFGLLALILFLVVPSRVAASGAGCATADPCNPGAGKIGLTIDCDPAGTAELTVAPATCGSPGPATYTLLRVAVRCFDSGEPEQARYTDRHGFDIASGPWVVSDSNDTDGLLSGCENFLAAAHWNRNGTEVQAQCVKVATPALVPDCVAPTVDETADLTHRISLYSQILPVEGANSCAPDPVGNSEVSRVELRSGPLERSYQGVVGGRYICTQSTSTLTACDDGSSTIQPRGQQGNVFGYTVGPNDYRVYRVNEPTPGFNHCCDSELRTGTSELTGDLCTASNAIQCSPLDILCANSVGMAVCRAGPTACALPSAPFLPLTRVIWHGPASDIDPGDSATASASDVPNACYRFSFSDLTLANEEFTTPFDFADPPVVGTPTEAGCGVATHAYRDTDFDEVYDGCDPVLGNISPADGRQKLVLKNRLRNRGFSSSFDVVCNPFCDTIHIGDLPAVIDPVSTATQLTVEIPATPVAGALSIVRNQPPPELTEIALQPFVPRWFGYVSDGTNNGVSGFDLFQELVRDVNASPTQGRIDLDCLASAGIATVKPPLGLDARPVEVSVTPPLEADREIFVVSEVITDSNAVQGRLFGFDVQNHRVITPGGILLPGLGRAIDVETDLSGVSRAYVARAQGLFNGTISVVNVDPASGSALWHVDDGPIVPGVPYAIRVTAAGSTVKAYVTSVECGPGGGLQPTLCEGGGALGPQGGFGAGGMEEMMGPPMHCIDCEGGGSGPWRRIMLSKYDVTDPENIAVECSQVLSWLTIPGDCNSSTIFANVGMAFSLDRTKLFVANPDQDRVDILDLATDPPEDPILVPVGDEPVDVAVVQTAGDFSQERAYVTNRLGQSVSVLSVATPMLVAMIELTAQEPNPPVQPVAIAALADGTRLFVANNQHGTIKVVNIDTDSAFENTVVRTIGVGPAVKRLVLLTLPPLPLPPP